MEKRLQFRQQHILDYTSIRNRTGYDQHFHLACWAEVNTAMEKCLQFWYRASTTVQQHISTGVEKEMIINTSTSIVERKLTLQQRSVSNFDVPLYNRLCQFRYWHWHILDSASIRHCTTGCEPMLLKVKSRSTLPLRLSSRSQHHRGVLSPISTPTHTRLLEHPPPYNSLWALAFKKKSRSTLPLRLSIWS